MLNFWMQIAGISYATEALFFGSAFVYLNNDVVDNRRVAGQPSSLEIQVGSNGAISEFVWGDVLKGIEEMSHNVTAALLTLQLGTMSANCSFDQQVAYQYSPIELWAPYGVSNCSLLRCYDLTFSPINFYRQPWALL